MFPFRNRAGGSWECAGKGQPRWDVEFPRAGQGTSIVPGSDAPWSIMILSLRNSQALDDLGMDCGQGLGSASLQLLSIPLSSSALTAPAARIVHK